MAFYCGMWRDPEWLFTEGSFTKTTNKPSLNAGVHNQRKFPVGGISGFEREF